MKKLLALLVVGSLLALATGCPPAATEPEPSKKNNPNPPTPPPTPPGKEATKGKVTKIEGGDITVGEKKVSVTPGATITVDGKEAKDLKGVTVGPDTTATINYDKDGKVTTVAIEKGTAAPMTEPPPPTKGKVTKIEGGDITVNDKKVSVTPGATITVDGKDAKDLKGVTVGPDTTATINYDKDGKVTTVVIEKGTAAPAPEVTPPTKGKVTKIEGGDITIVDKKISVTPGAKITVDGKDAPDLKGVTVGPDTTATVIYDKDGKVTNVDIKTK